MRQIRFESSWVSQGVPGQRGSMSLTAEVDAPSDARELGHWFAEITKAFIDGHDEALREIYGGPPPKQAEWREP
jgi:hypothetical protein